MSLGDVRPWEESYAERFKDRLPKVYIGFIAYGDIYPEVFLSAIHWAFQAGARYKGKFEFCWAQEPFAKKEQYRARNSLTLEAQKAGADFVLTLDDDHTLADCPDIVGHFFREEKPLQGGLYIQRTDEIEQPVICKSLGGDKYGFCSYEELPPYPGGPVEVLGGGVNWIDARLLDFMQEPHYWPPNTAPEGRTPLFLPNTKYGLDLQLCRAATALGVTPWLNRNVELGHVVHERSILRPRGKEGNAICPQCTGLMIHDRDRWRCNTCQTEAQAA
tara:strand:+ start:2371 stop:3192 length:822 start_codon:yes stop_codon:yes gene_type:complete